MKIDRTKLKKSSSEVPPDCKALIDRLSTCSPDLLLDELLKIKAWNWGKCELYHWIDVLDAFDYILQTSTERSEKQEIQWCLPCDTGPSKRKRLLLCILQFTALLIEHSFSRHLYNSMEHLTTLLSSSDMNVVLAVLNLLYVFSKRSNFITRLNANMRSTLLLRLSYLAESWGGKENGFGLAECCQNLPVNAYPASASTLHFEYYAENVDDKSVKRSTNTVIAIHMDNVDQIPQKSPSHIMEELIAKYSVPVDKQMQLYTHLRLAHSFSDYSKRILCVQARLQSLSVLVYSNAVPGVTSLLYNGLIEELVDVLELQDQNLIEIKAAALRTLTSIIHLDRNPKLSAIIDATGAASYHGFLPVLVRSCIQSLIEPAAEAFPLPFATALFSFLYHLASYESGGDALVSCGMMEALLKVINWHSTETEHITFVTRAVRVIDLITNLDMQAFQAHNGLASFISRLEIEVNVCRLDQPFLINPKVNELKPEDSNATDSMSQSQTEMDVDFPSFSDRYGLEDSESSSEPQAGTSSKKGVCCFPQRAALLKSTLNFLKKSIQDPAFSDNIRHLMDGSLAHSLKHIISNAEYYGPSLFLLAMDVVTVYIFQEPTLLLPLQQSGLTDVMLHALLIKEVPATREVLASLPNVFSALCLNTRGLKAFVACKPFEKLFRALVSPEYLPAMRRRRSADPIGDAASHLGTSMDELMRHQPSLRADATAAIIKLLEELSAMGRDPRYVCTKPATKPETTTVTRIANISNDASSDEEEDDDDDTSGAPVQAPIAKPSTDSSSKTAVPLVDYILNVMRFVDAILSNNSTDDHCREFVKQKGLVPLMSILGLPNLPIDFPITPTCQAISSVCKSILNLAHEPQVLKQGLLHLNEVLHNLEHLHRPVDPPGGSVLLEELISAPNVTEATQIAQSTPLLHYMSAAHAYIRMFIHVCRTGQGDIRTISISHWGSELGLTVLKGLSSLYTSLVWESTVLLALCSNDSALAEDIQFGRQQLEKLVPKDSKDAESTPISSPAEFGSSGVLSAMEALSTSSFSPEMAAAMDVEDSSHCISAEDSANGASTSLDKQKSKTYSSQIKQIKPLLSGASRLGRALAELFGLLVKLCVGSPTRQRRGQQIPPSPSMPSPAAKAVASALTKLLAMGLSWEPPPASPVPKFRLTFYICSVGFASPMLFDERKFPYHLMLHMFLCNGGLEAFFGTFEWALTCEGTVNIEEGLEHPELPDGTGEFLDAWLMLLEKMCNPKTILDSPHTLPVKVNQSTSTFNPLLFLIHIQKRAFKAISHLWDRKPPLSYGDRIAESMLTIICHIFKSETVIKTRLAKEQLKTTGPQTKSATKSAAPAEAAPSTLNEDHLTQLIDMGFSRGLATEALSNSASLEQATEYLLTYPAGARRSSLPDSTITPGLGMDWEMSEEDQMLHAIAISLGENVLVSTNQGEGETSKTEQKAEIVQEPEEPLSSEDIDKFTDKIVDGCLKLVDVWPDTVYRCCDLLLAVADRNGDVWQSRCLVNRLSNEINVKMYEMINRLTPDQISIDRKGWVDNSKLPWMPNDPKFTVRLHLFTLLMEEMKFDCAAAIDTKELIPTFISVLELSSLCLKSLKDEAAPKWLSFIILIIDLYEKAAVTCQRKSPIYSINEETGKRRPIMITLRKTQEEKDNAKSENKEKGASEETAEAYAIDSNAAKVEPLKIHCTSTCPMKQVKRLKSNQCKNLVRFCVTLLKVPLDADTLHAVMRLCLRLTRTHGNAVLFASMGGPKTLLNLTQQNSFAGFTSLTALLFRHILEDSNTLTFAMEKVIRSAASGTIGQTPLRVSKEIHYVFRVLGPAACREPDIFTTVATNTLRLSIMPAKRENPMAMENPTSVQMFKTTPNKVNSADYTYDSEIANGLMYDLLMALIAKDYDGPEEVVIESSPEDNAVPMSDQEPSPAVEPSGGELLQCDDDEEEDGLIPLHIRFGSPESLNSPQENRNKDAPKDPKADNLKNLLIIRKSGICRILAELVRSYPQCARLIADYGFSAGDSELITEDCTALAFVLDNLLHTGQTCGDKETPTLSRVLITALASCNHSVEAQTILVSEVRLALLRALQLPESSEKHQRIQALTGLISMMIDACPPPQNVSIHANPVRPPPSGMNNIVKILFKKGIIVDLARIPHYLDLSSPYMATTVNSSLKPLETLSRIVNLPSSNPSNKSKGKTTSSSAETSDAAPEAMEEDSSARSSDADVAMPLQETESQAQDMSIIPTFPTFDVLIDENLEELRSLEGLMNEIRSRQDPGPERPTTRGSRNAEQAINVTVEMDSDSQIGTRRSAAFADTTREDPQESSDSDSNSESGHTHSEDDAERDEDDAEREDDAGREDDADRDDREEDDEEEDDPRFDDNGEEDDYSGIEDFFRDQDRDDSLFFQLEEVFPALSGSSVIIGGADAVRTFQFPVAADEATTANNDTPAHSAPTALRTVPTVHPLLVRQDDASCSTTSRAAQRRQQRYRTNLGGHTWHMYATANGNGTTRHQACDHHPAGILQRSQPSIRANRATSSFARVFANSELLGGSDILTPTYRILATEDEDQAIQMNNDNSNMLSSVSSTLNRWAEESRVLDGDSIHDCITVLKPYIIKTLEGFRESEIVDRKEKGKKIDDKVYEKHKEGIVSLNDQIERLAEERRSTTMEIASRASQLESLIATARDRHLLPANVATNVNMPDDIPVQGFDSPSGSFSAADVETIDLVEADSSSDVQEIDMFDLRQRTRDDSQGSPDPEDQEHSAADVETIDLIDADSSCEVQEIDMSDPSDRQRTSDGSGATDPNRSRAADFLRFLMATPRPPMRIAEVRHSDSICEVERILSRSLSNEEAPLENVPAQENPSEDSTVSVINLATSPDVNTDSPTTEEPSSNVPEASTGERTTVIATSSCDKSVTDAPPAEVSNVEPEDSASPWSSSDIVLQQPRISTPSLISEDAVSSERPTAQESSSTPSDFSNVLGAGIEIPEGVDPSFLAALPDNIRQEVIAEQLRLQRLRQQSSSAGNDGNGEDAAFTEVNPEFLAALPLNIQEEVLAQQRAEQQRLAALNSNPDVPVDPTNFIQTLPQGLRQQVLADMDDSLLAHLPTELATEAQSLRRELEARHRQIQERFFSTHAGTAALSRILRTAGRVGARYTIHSGRGQWTSWNTLSPRGAGSASGSNPALAIPASTSKLRGRLLLDHEALACLIVLLFVDEPQLNTARLHRVLRNLCHYAPTRLWVVESLLSILERTKDYQATETPKDSHRHKKSPKGQSDSSFSQSSGGKSDSSNRSDQPSWLSISLDAALGCRTNVFQIRRLTTTRRATERHSATAVSPNAPSVTIHPLASPVICRHVLDTLISLAKSFPVHFLPESDKKDEKSKDTPDKKDEKSKDTPGKKDEKSKDTPEKKDKSKDTPNKRDPKHSKSSEDRLSASTSKSGASRSESDFWDVLVKLDSLSTTTSRKGKTPLRTQSFSGSSSSALVESEGKGGFKSSPLAQLIGLLAHPVVKRSSVLTDRLLRLLALISLALPEPKNTIKGKIITDFRRQVAHVQVDESAGLDSSLLVMPVPEPVVEKPPKRGRPKSKTSQPVSPADMDEETAIKHYLRLAVQVLTSKTCSEEGLEDATALLLRLSRGCINTKRTVLYLLMDGARELGGVVCKNIRSLMLELRNLNPGASDSDDVEHDGRPQAKGVIQDRFTKGSVVITASSKVKGRSGRELQLPSMSSLTSKASSQAFFLRILKVIIQLLESPPLTHNRAVTQEPEVDTEANVTGTNTDSPPVDPEASSETQVSRPTKSKTTSEKDKCPVAFHLSGQLALDELWTALSDCLQELADTPDHHAVLVLQPAVEAFFLVHASLDKKDKKKDSRKDSQDNEISHLQDQSNSEQSLQSSHESSSSSNVSIDTEKFLKFAETHRTVLNQILRQTTTPLSDGPFSVLVDHTRVLDFDIKRRYFRQELERMDEGSRREDLAIHVKREHVFEDSYRELHRRSPEEWKNRLYIVFEGEEGQDAGGLLREWYTIISREIFNPMYALFTISPGDRVTYMINSSSHCNSNHLSYFKFVGRVIAKAVYDNKLLESYFTRSFYKHILGKSVKYTDMESEDYSFYQGLVFLQDNSVNSIGYDLTFSVELQEFGVTEIRDLIPNGRNLPVTEENKFEYVKLVCQEKMTGAIRKQLEAFLEGFYEIVPKRLISIFNEQELELLISGLPNIDIDDLKANTEYHKYQATSLQIQWFWRAMRSFDQSDRANFLQFVTGTSKVPLQGFAALEGMNGTQKFQIHRDDRTDRLPSAHTCFNQLDLPAYETYDKLRSMLLKAIHECSEGFGFA